MCKREGRRREGGIEREKESQVDSVLSKESDAGFNLANLKVVA